MRCSRNQLSDITGLHVKTIDERVKAGMPYIAKPGEEGATQWLFDTVAVIEWLMGQVDAVNNTDEMKGAKTKDAVYTAALKELDFNERAGIMFYEDEIREPWQEMLSVLKSRLVAMPGRMAQLVAVESDVAKCLNILKTEINDMLKGLSMDELLLQMRARRTRK